MCHVVAFKERDEISVFFFQEEEGIRDGTVTGVQTCALPILSPAHGHPDVPYKPHLRHVHPDQADFSLICMSQEFCYVIYLLHTVTPYNHWFYWQIQQFVFHTYRPLSYFCRTFFIVLWLNRSSGSPLHTLL